MNWLYRNLKDNRYLLVVVIGVVIVSVTTYFINDQNINLLIIVGTFLSMGFAWEYLQEKCEKNETEHEFFDWIENFFDV